MTTEVDWRTQLAAAASIVAGGIAYIFLAEPSTGSYLAYPLAIAIALAAWRYDARLDADGWVKLGAVILGAILLLAGKGWRGDVGLWPPWQIPTGIPWQLLTFSLTTILIFVLFALGLNLEFGFGGLINFGHVAFMSIGAYIVALLSLQTGLWATQPGILLALVLAMGGAALAGLVLALPAIRLREDYLAIVTIAAAEILRRFLQNEAQWTQGARGITVPSANRPLSLDWLSAVPGGETVLGGLNALTAFFGFTGTPYLFILLVMTLAGTLLVVWLLERMVASPWGRVVQAIREDEDAVRALGVNPTIYKLQLLAIGSAIAALAGALWAWQISFVVPAQFTAPVTFWAWIMIVIGGAGHNKGAVAGAFIFWTLNELTTNVDQLSNLGLDSEQIAAFATFALGALLVAFMLFKPEGLFGDREEMELVE